LNINSFWFCLDEKTNLNIIAEEEEEEEKQNLKRNDDTPEVCLVRVPQLIDKLADQYVAIYNS
jgi:hypothetical protein